MNAKTYQTQIDAMSKEIFAFDLEASKKIARVLNSQALPAVIKKFSEPDVETISSGMLAHILAAHCSKCKLTKQERLAQTRRTLDEFWKTQTA